LVGQPCAVCAQAALDAATRATRELEALPEVALGGGAICAPPLYNYVLW
jgi:hypothetical protein